MDRLDPRRTALVLIDLQQGILPFAGGPHSAATVLANATKLATRFRALSAPVVLVRVGWSADFGDALRQPVDHAPPSPPKLPDNWWEIPAELDQQPADILITKRQWNAFYGTELDLQLRRRGIGQVVLGGIATNFGVESTARDAWQNDYSVIIAEDACSSMGADLHAFAIEKTLPRISMIRSSTEILAALAA